MRYYIVKTLIFSFSRKSTLLVSSIYSTT